MVASFLMTLMIVMIPLSASAQYYYDQPYYPTYDYGYTGGYAAYTAPAYSYTPSYNYSYVYPTYTNPYNYNSGYNNNYGYNANYNYGYGYSPYSYSTYNKSASQELQYITDIDGNKIGEYDRTGTSYNPYYNGNYYNTTTSTNYYNGGTYTIEIDDNHYVPMSVTLKKGTTVKWVNRDSRNHSVTGDRSSYNIESNTLKRNESYTKQFNTTGTFLYHDRFNNRLKGKIVVVN